MKTKHTAIVFLVAMIPSTLALFGAPLPGAIMEISALIAIILSMPFVPVMRLIGLVQGEYWTGPSIIEWLIVLAIYMSIIFGVGRLFRKKP